MKDKTSVSHEDYIIRRLRDDPKFAAEYFKQMLEEDDDPASVLIGLRQLVKAQGITKIAKAVGMERESLSRSLSAQGNPRLSTLLAVTNAIGVRLALVRHHVSRRKVSTRKRAA